MDWSQYSVSAMQLEVRFGDRVVPTFCERPRSIWGMVWTRLQETRMERRWSAASGA